MSLTVKARFMRHAVLQGTSHDGLAIDNAVGLGYNTAIDGSWLMSARGTMVLGSLGDDIDFLFIKPMPQALIITHNSCAVDMMLVSTKGEP